MLCKKVQEELIASQYNNQEPSAELLQHAASCAQCRLVIEQNQQLDVLLNVDQEIDPRPGFDTRFFARLEETKTKQPERKFQPLLWAAIAFSACAIIVGLFFFARPTPTIPIETWGQDLALIMELELLENYQILSQFEDIEAYEVLAQIDIEELDRLLEEENK